ncbi:MAG: zf-HC2 domain-containing protein [Acidobacteriota bacterium]|nr:zf-HC2 domain-containing protein [Acidobacteriota bacterium]
MAHRTSAQFFGAAVYMSLGLHDEPPTLALNYAERGDVVSDDCPAPELLAVYLEGLGSDSERRHIEAHLADCQDCRRIVAMIVRSEAAVPDPSSTNHK